MFVTFTRCEWGGGARRLIKAAGMLIGRGRRRRPLCSARSHWASVAPVKGQRSDLKSVTLTPLHLCPSIHTHRLSHFAPPHLYSSSWRKMEPFFGFSHFLWLPNQVVGTPHLSQPPTWCVWSHIFCGGGEGGWLCACFWTHMTFSYLKLTIVVQVIISFACPDILGLNFLVICLPKVIALALALQQPGGALYRNKSQ